MEKQNNPFSGELKGKLLKNLDINPSGKNLFEVNLIPNLEKDKDGMFRFSLKDNRDVIFSKVPLATITANVVLIEEKNIFLYMKQRFIKIIKEKV